MILLVDLGNTRIKWAELENAVRGTGDAAIWDDGRLEKTLDRHWSGFGTPDQLVICNVAGPETGAALLRWVDERWGCPIRNLRSEAHLDGVSNAYPETERLGIDRMVAMVGARALHPGPLCVIDVGTALTLDALDAGGQHLGGLIAPGPEMMLTSLGQTGDILMDRDGEVTEFATSTPDAVASGVVLSAVALVERFATSATNRLGENVTLVVTGGGAHRILSQLKGCRHEPDLVLEGLAVIAREDD